MANPQLEDGHIRIANEIWRRWTKMRVPGQAEQVLKAIVDKTYGWRKKTDWISISQLSKSTGLRDSHVCRAVKLLLKLNMIIKKGNDSRPTYGLQKDYDLWKPLPKKVTIKKVITQKGYQGLPIKGDTKNQSYQEPIKKELPADKPPTELKADPTYRKTLDRLIAEIYRSCKIKLDYEKAGLFYKKAESYGQAIVAVKRALKKIREQNQQMDKLIPYVVTELKPESRKYWREADWTEVKSENQALDVWLNRECNKTIGDVFKKLARR